MQTRRAALLTIAGAAASPLLAQPSLAQEAAHVMAEDAAPVMSFEPVYFQHGDYAIVSRLADLILPRTDTPGALDAHVPYRIDSQVKTSPVLQREFEEGLASLRAADFVSLPEAQQVSLLTAMGDSPFFHTVKALTVDWYYRSEEGLVKELGFHGNTYRSEFPGCVHPEHWPDTHQGTK